MFRIYPPFYCIILMFIFCQLGVFLSTSKETNYSIQKYLDAFGEDASEYDACVGIRANVRKIDSIPIRM